MKYQTSFDVKVERVEQLGQVPALVVEKIVDVVLVLKVGSDEVDEVSP